MSSSTDKTNVDVAELVQSIRQQISRAPNAPSGHTPERRGEDPVMAQSVERLQLIGRDLESLGSQFQNGEPRPAPQRLRARFGSSVKRRLYRLLWWQGNQIGAFIDLVIRRGREEVTAIQVLSQRIRRQTADMSRLNQSLLECKRQNHDSENRLQQLESAQLRLQAAEIERNVKWAAQLETELASLRQDVNQQLARQIEAVRQESEQLSARLSELGLYTHQTRTALSIQDRRLTVFIEEARKRLPESFTDDQLRQVTNQHNDHRYDSIYVAFEDVFRGSREEIKARQSVYLPLLKDSGIGSAEMPVLDLGCGRGEWLELLREHNLQAQGLDRNETMIESCKSGGLQVAQGDVLPYLRTLPDSSLGCISSFHMIEHVPFETVLALVDEALRVLKAGGVLILETPNPQNILVGSHSFYFDPSHLKPLPSPMLRFFVEARGFCDVHVWNLHPYPEAARFPDDGKGMANRLSDYLYGPQDYAVIGRRP